MSLAWTHLNRSQPDLTAAAQYAQAALALVPYWHYVKDILLPQIAMYGDAHQFILRNGNGLTVELAIPFRPATVRNEGELA